MKIKKATYASINRSDNHRLGECGEIIGVKCLDDNPCFEVLYPDKSIEYRKIFPEEEDTEKFYRGYVVVPGNKGFSY